MDKDTFSSDVIGYVTIPLDEVYFKMNVQKKYEIMFEGMLAGELSV